MHDTFGSVVRTKRPSKPPLSTMIPGIVIEHPVGAAFADLARMQDAWPDTTITSEQPEDWMSKLSNGTVAVHRVFHFIKVVAPPRPPRWSTLARYASVPAATLLGFTIQYALLPEPSIAPFVFFYFSVMLAAWIGGLIPGLLTVAALAVLGNYFFVAPYHAWAMSGPAVTATALFVMTSSAVAVLTASFRAAVFRAERTAESLRQQITLVHLSHDAVLVRQLTGPIESWSRGAEELYGFSVAEAQGRVAHELLQTTFPEPEPEITAALRTRERWEGELVQRTKDGRTVTVSAKVQMVRDNDGNERVLESHHDISARTEAEAALRSADQRKNEFLAMLSHELRNPLAPIRNALFILDHAQPGSEQALRAKAIVDRQVGQLTRLVDDLLDVTRISRGKMQVQRSRLELAPLFERTVEDYQPMMMASGIELTMRVTEKPLFVNGDEARIAQSIGNLLSNAAKFTKRGGHVLAVLEEDPARRMAVLRVCDDGVGMDPALLARVFRPFEQADRTFDGTRVSIGLGLGLALVKGLIEQHGGEVDAQSGGPGTGSEFILRLPLVEAAMTTAPSGTKPSARPARRVLVIEDNVDAADSLREVLELGGHEVEVAHDGFSGLDKARAFNPEVVICDIGLPGMDGYDVARGFRAEEALRSTYLVALTGYASPNDVAKAREAGFDQHLAKPPTISKLHEILTHSRSADSSSEIHSMATGT